MNIDVIAKAPFGKWVDLDKLVAIDEKIRLVIIPIYTDYLVYEFSAQLVEAPILVKKVIPRDFLSQHGVHFVESRDEYIKQRDILYAEILEKAQAELDDLVKLWKAFKQRQMKDGL